MFLSYTDTVYTVSQILMVYRNYSEKWNNLRHEFKYLYYITVAPQRPRIEHRSGAVLPGHNVTVKSGDKATVKCLSRYGNPPATLKWFLGKCCQTSSRRLSSFRRGSRTGNPWVRYISENQYF